MDNLFVVDGSIFPGIMTGNPSAMIGTRLPFAPDHRNEDHKRPGVK